MRIGAPHRLIGCSSMGLAILLATGLEFPAHAGAMTGPEINAPAFAQEPLPGGALISWASIDPTVMDLRTAVATGPGCRAPGAGTQCTSTVAGLAAPLRGVAAVNANYTNGDVPLGLAVADHAEVGANDAHTTTLCVGDRDAQGHVSVAIGKNFTATACRTAVAGEGIVSAGGTAIEGTGDEGNRARFWFSVDHPFRVERTLVGLRGDGSLLVGVASSDRAGGRSGMSLPEAALWMIQHGAMEAIALDGGHMSDAWVSGVGDISPLEQGRPPVKTALVFVPVVWRFALPVPPPIPTPTPTPTPTPLPAASAPPAPSVPPRPFSPYGPRISMPALPSPIARPGHGLTRLRIQLQRILAAT